MGGSRRPPLRSAREVAARITESAHAAISAEAPPPPSLESRNSVSVEATKSTGRNSGTSFCGVTQVAMSALSRADAYCLAVSYTPSLVSGGPSTVPFNWAATAVNPWSRKMSRGRRSAGKANQVITSVIGRLSRAAARNSWLRTLLPALDQKSPCWLASTDAARKCPANRPAPSRDFASANGFHHMVRGAWAICWGSIDHTRPTLLRASKQVV